jgi:hypothetical protein
MSHDNQELESFASASEPISSESTATVRKGAQKNSGSALARSRRWVTASGRRRPAPSGSRIRSNDRGLNSSVLVGKPPNGAEGWGAAGFDVTFRH